jgi:hypothetical protein
VHRKAALVVDDLVPHAEAALFRLAEVVRVKDARDAVVEVDGNAAVVRVTGGGQVGCVDHGDLRFAAGALEVEVLLHTGDVRVGALDDETGGRLHFFGVGDVAVYHDHRPTRDVLVLETDDLFVLGAGHRLVSAIVLR